VVDKKLAGSHKPGLYPSDLETDLKVLKEKHGISAIVSLSDTPLDTQTIKKFDMNVLYLPVKDYYPPTIEQMVKMVNFVDEQKGATLVHCNAGLGRTGTMLAAYLIAKGMPVSEAIKKLRKERKGSIQTNKQEDSLKA